MSSRSGSRDMAKEEVWRNRIEKWRASNLSQAEFCRKEGLSPNTFASWKTIIARRDAGRNSRKPADPNSTTETVAPGFVRLSLDDVVKEREELREQASRTAGERVLAAELIDANTGRKLRIFNGADQAVVASLLVVFSGGQSGR